MAGAGHIGFRAHSWLRDYKGDATDTEWPALRSVACEQFRADCNNTDLDDDTREFARKCLELLRAD